MNIIDLKKAKDEAISKAIKDHKVFFAFSKEQFESSKTKLQPNEKYVSLQGGRFIPELQFNSFIKEMVKIRDDFKKAVEKNNLKEKQTKKSLKKKVKKFLLMQMLTSMQNN